VFATAALFAAPALAAQHGHSSNHAASSFNRGGAASHAQPRSNFAPAPRAAAPSVRNNVRGPVVGQAAPRANIAPHYAPHYAPSYGSHYNGPSYNHYGYGYGYGHGYYGSGYGYYRPGFYVRPFAFRPQFSIGFGLYAGYPVPWAWDYSYPVTVYGYAAPPNQVVVGPNTTQYGAITFEISPTDADIYIDGNYAGKASDFDPSRQPMTLAVGTHHVQVVAQGFQPLSFDVGVQPGQVIPYRGTLQQ
jgi:hypothetical protein